MQKHFLRRVAVGLALGGQFLTLAPVMAQAPVMQAPSAPNRAAPREELQVYPVYSRSPVEVQSQLTDLLRNVREPSEVIADAQNGRVVVRGSESVQSFVRQVLSTLEGPAPATAAPVLKTYSLPPRQLDEIAARLKQQHAADPQVRIAVDPRMSQILVFAPPQAQAAIAADLPGAAGTAASSAQLPTATPMHSHVAPGSSLQSPAAPLSLSDARGAAPTTHASTAPAWTAIREPAAAERMFTRSWPLRNLEWRGFEAALQTLSARPLPVTTARNGEVATYSFTGRTTKVQVAVDRRSGTVSVEAPERLLESWGKLLAAIDVPVQSQQGDRFTRLVSLSHAEPAATKKAIAALQGGRSLGAATGANSQTAEGVVTREIPIKSTPLAVSMFQPRDRNHDAAGVRLAQAEAPAADSGTGPAIGAPAAAVPAVAAPAVGAAVPAVPAAEGAVPGAAPATPGAAAASDAEGSSSVLGSVQIEFNEELGIMIIRGNKRDVDRVTEIINKIEELSVETQPDIEIYQLKYVASDLMANLVRQLYDQVLSSRQGRVSITALVKPNALLLIGRKENTQSVLDLVKLLDQPVSPTSQFRVFPLKHISASTAQTTIQEFYVDRGGLSPRVTATADVRSNSLIVQASPRDLAEVDLLLKRLDTSTSAAENELRVFPLTNSLAEDLAPILQSAIAGQAGTAGARRTGPGGQQQGGLTQALPGALAQGAGAATGGAAGGLPTATTATKSTMLRFMTIDSQGQRQLKSGILSDVRITADPRANALLISAPAESMELLAALVKQLDQTPTAEAQIKVFTIVNGDATALTQMLQNLFGRAAGTAAGGGAGGFGNLQQAVNVQAESTLVPLRFSVDQRTNSIVASGAAGDLNVVEAILLRLDDSDVRQRKSIVYRLKNAPALDVANAVNEFLRSERQVQQSQPNVTSPFEQIEKEVVVVPEIVSNSLILSATPRYFDEIRKLVEQLDERPPMVMIQVLIAEVGMNNTDEFGIELGLQDSVLFDRSLLGDLVTTTTTTISGDPPVTTQQQNVVSATNNPGFNFNNQPLGNSGSSQALANSSRVGAQGLSHFAVGRTNSELGFGGLVLSASSESLSILLRALNECRRLDVLSRPQVMTLDNQPAFIQVGQRVPRISGTSTTDAGLITNTITNENVGLILGVTPRISPDGLVVMEIDAEKSELGPDAEGIPISISANGDVIRSPRINTTTAQTTVSALSGQTVVLGGLITKSKSGVHRRVPILSDIPILGNLFRYDNVVNRRTELLIIMTPRIVRNEQDVELIKQVESSRLSWCLADVTKLHGEAGLRSRKDEWKDSETKVVYPDEYPEVVIEQAGTHSVVVKPKPVELEPAKKKSRFMLPFRKSTPAAAKTQKPSAQATAAGITPAATPVAIAPTAPAQPSAVQQVAATAPVMTPVVQQAGLQQSAPGRIPSEQFPMATGVTTKVTSVDPRLSRQNGPAAQTTPGILPTGTAPRAFEPSVGGPAPSLLPMGNP